MKLERGSSESEWEYPLTIKDVRIIHEQLKHGSEVRDELYMNQQQAPNQSTLQMVSERSGSNVTGSNVTGQTQTLVNSYTNMSGAIITQSSASVPMVTADGPESGVTQGGILGSTALGQSAYSYDDHFAVKIPADGPGQQTYTQQSKSSETLL